ncbi:hypothetical protein FACS189490_12650 [Clostridia bacterium]|nr:hypothetical protein FACS189490_12650 [Clostridia bacterium]
MSFVAQTERDNLLSRQAKGIAEARKRGVRFGRPPKNQPPDFEQIQLDYLAKKISSRKAAELAGVCQRTFLKWAKK